MSEIVDINKLTQSIPSENLEAYKIHSQLEHLPTNFEFDDFIKENLAAKCQYIKIPKLYVRRSDMSDELKGLDLFPGNFTTNKIRVALLQDKLENDWQLSVNFNVGDDKFRCLGDELGFEVNASGEQDDFSQLYDQKIGYHLIHCLLKSSGYDTDKFNISDWEKLYDNPEISEHIIEPLAIEYKSETITTSNLILGPCDYGIIASQNAKNTRFGTSTDIKLNVFKQLAASSDGKPKTLIYEYNTSLDDGTTDLKTSKVTWQILNGDMSELGKSLEIIKFEQTHNPPEEISPLTNFEAWKKFMQIADSTLCYAMRGGDLEE